MAKNLHKSLYFSPLNAHTFENSWILREKSFLANNLYSVTQVFIFQWPNLTSKMDFQAAINWSKKCLSIKISERMAWIH